jgi:hypothetical protein
MLLTALLLKASACDDAIESGPVRLMLRRLDVLRIVAWFLLLAFVPLVLFVFIFTHLGALLWLSLILAVAAAIYGMVMSRRPPVT